jgi:hypothetical protein
LEQGEAQRSERVKLGTWGHGRGSDESRERLRVGRRRRS